MSAPPRRPDDGEPPAHTTSGFFVMRTPLLPFDEWAAWSRDLELPGAAAGPAAEAAFDRDVRRLRERLRGWVVRPEIREAIYLASPSLDDAIDAWLAGDAGEDHGPTERSVLRYLSRA